MGIIVPYLIATAIGVVFYNGGFDLEIYLHHLVHFDAVAAFYFVLLYIQLVLISPMLYSFFSRIKGSKFEHFIEVGGFVVTFIVSLITINYTNILSVYGGGGKLFGGSYLILLYLGMWFGKYYKTIQMKKWFVWVLFAVGTVGSFLAWLFIAYIGFRWEHWIPMGYGVNPPNITLLVYTTVIAVAVYASGKVVEVCGNGVITGIYNGIAWVGKHTLYIFCTIGFLQKFYRSFLKAV